MKLLLILHAVVSVANSLPRIEEDSSGPYWSKNGFEGVLQEPPNSSILFQRRFSRANADNIKAPLERLQMIARITNGIYLYQGLSAGSIPSDALISELLFFGSVKPSDVAQMDYQKIQTAIDMLGNLPKSLDATTPEVNKVEKAVAGLAAVLKEVDGIGNIKEWNEGKTQFKTEIEKLANSGINTTILNTLHTAGNWNGHFENINKNQADQDTFPDIKKALNSLKTAITDIDKPVLEWTFNGFAEAMDGIAPITKAAKGATVFQGKYNDVQVKDDMVNAYSAFLEDKAKDLVSLTSVTPQLAAIKSLISTRHRRDRQRQLQHTHGLPSGTSDVAMMIPNAGYPWIGKIVTTDALKNAFKKFETLGNLLNGLETSLQVSDDGVAKMKGLVKHASSVVDVFGDMEKVKTGLNQIRACQLPNPLDVDSKEFDKVKTALESIDTKLSDLREQKKSLFKILKTQGLIEMCNDVIKICENAQKASDVQSFVDQFKNYKKLTELNKKIIEIYDIAKTIDSKKVKAEAETAKSNFPALDTYHTELNQYADYFKCLQEKKEMKLVFEAVAQIQKMRGFKSDNSFSTTLKDGRTVVQKVTGTKGDLTKLKTAIDEWKGTNTHGLEVFEKVDEHSKVIGGSVQGVANMRNALEQKSTVEKVLSSLPLVKNNSQLVTDPKDGKNLDDLIGMESVILKMYTSLDTFNGVVNDSDSLMLKNHSALFIQAKKLVTGITGATGKFLAMSSTIKELQTKMANPSQLHDLQSSLEDMALMGLDFTKHHTSFDASESSLAAMDTFFVKYNKRMAPTTPAPGIIAPGKPSQQGLMNGQTEKSMEEDKSLLSYIGGGVGLLLLLLLLVFTAIYQLCVAPCLERKRTANFLDSMMREHSLRGVFKGPDDIKAKEVFDRMAQALKETSETRIYPDMVECKGPDCGWDAGIVKKSAVVLKGYGSLFKTNFYPAMIVPMGWRRRVIVAQPPTIGSDATLRPEEKYYWMAKQYRSQTIVLLSKPKKRDGHRRFQDHVPIKKRDILTLGIVTVECLSMETVKDPKKYPQLEGVIEIRQLKVTFKGHKPFTVRHIWYLGEEEELAKLGPLNTFDLVYILNMVQKDKKPPIYTSHRTWLALCLSTIEHGAILSRKKGDLTLAKLDNLLCKTQFIGLCFPMHYMAALLGLYELITQNKKVKVKSETEKTYKEYKKHWKPVYEDLLNPKSEPEPEKKSEKKPEKKKKTDDVPAKKTPDPMMNTAKEQKKQAIVYLFLRHEGESIDESEEAPVPGSEKAKAPVPGSQKAKAPVPGSQKAKAPVPGSQKAKAPVPESQKAEAPVPGSQKAEDPVLESQKGEGVADEGALTTKTAESSEKTAKD